MVKTSLRFTNAAWLLWKELCKQSQTEIGCWGIADHADDLLLVTRLYVPMQECTAASVEREADQTIAAMKWGLAEGLQPAQITRVWLHTHPGNSARPSSTDESYWAEHATHGSVMGILAKGGETFARLAVRGDDYSFDVEIPVCVEEDATYADEAKKMIAQCVKDRWVKPVTVKGNWVEWPNGEINWRNTYWNHKTNNWEPIDPATRNQKQPGESKASFAARMGGSK